jgi:hypothetical protein
MSQLPGDIARHVTTYVWVVLLPTKSEDGQVTVTNIARLDNHTVGTWKSTPMSGMGLEPIDTHKGLTQCWVDHREMSPRRRVVLPKLLAYGSAIHLQTI